MTVDERTLLRHLLPLPQEIQLDGQCEIDLSHIGIYLASDVGAPGQRAADVLQHMLGVRAVQSIGESDFTFVLGLVGDNYLK